MNDNDEVSDEDSGDSSKSVGAVDADGSAKYHSLAPVFVAVTEVEQLNARVCVDIPGRDMDMWGLQPTPISEVRT